MPDPDTRERLRRQRKHAVRAAVEGNLHALEEIHPEPETPDEPIEHTVERLTIEIARASAALSKAKPAEAYTAYKALLARYAPRRGDHARIDQGLLAIECALAAAEAQLGHHRRAAQRAETALNACEHLHGLPGTAGTLAAAAAVRIAAREHFEDAATVSEDYDCLLTRYLGQASTETERAALQALSRVTDFDRGHGAAGQAEARLAYWEERLTRSGTLNSATRLAFAEIWSRHVQALAETTPDRGRSTALGMHRTLGLLEGMPASADTRQRQYQVARTLIDAADLASRAGSTRDYPELADALARTGRRLRAREPGIAATRQRALALARTLRRAHPRNH